MPHERRLRAAGDWIAQRLADAPLGCIICHQGTMLHEHFHGAVTRDSVFEIGSLRKSFNSALVGCIAADRRDFSIHLRASDVWLDLLAISGDPLDTDITMHHLISGVSGWLTPDPPGTRFLYNSAAFTGAERVLARFLGLPNDEIAPEVARRFKEPLGAASWRFYHFAGELTPGDVENPGPKLAVDSTLGDLVTWGALWYNAGRWCGRQLIPQANLT